MGIDLPVIAHPEEKPGALTRARRSPEVVFTPSIEVIEVYEGNPYWKRLKENLGERNVEFGKLLLAGLRA